jgi:putative endonuclease
MNYYTYVLLSQKNKRLYVGSTENLEKRIERHNKGRVKSTKAGRTWKLLEKQIFSSRSEAYRYEMFLKTHQQRNLTKKRHKLK